MNTTDYQQSIIDAYLEKHKDFTPDTNIEEAFVEIHMSVFITLAKMLVIYKRAKANGGVIPPVDLQKLKDNWIEIMDSLIKLSKIEKKIPVALAFHLTGYEPKSNPRIELLEYLVSYSTNQLSKYEPQHWIQIGTTLGII